jgi:cell division protein FtsB
LFGLIVISVITGVVFGLRGPQGISTLYEKRREIQQLEEQNATLRKEVQERRDRIHQLQNNPTAQEEEIRRRYKLLKPGETTFILPQ